MQVSQAWLRVAGGLAVFALIVLFGLGLLGGLAFEEALDTFTLVMAVAIPAGVVSYGLIEYLQTRRLDSIRRQFDTRTLVLMPVAMALNIVLGTAVASALKIPVYLDSIGTILVAALAGPLAGAATGFLSNVVWTYLAPAPFGSPFAVPFAVVAVVVGLMAGTFARWGWFRPRRGSSGQRLIVGGTLSVAAVLLMVVVALQAWRAAAEGGDLAPASDDTAFLILGWVAMLLVAGTAIGLLYLLVRWRDLAVSYILAAGVATGVVAAFIAAPIAAGLFGGVTGSGADFVIAAFRQAGADLQQAVLGQSLISDPVDKVITYFVVYLILGAMAARTKARFPQGEYLLPLDDEDDRDTHRSP
ncbi:MAG: ECF transporter S component [Candidatus Limnocylindrales bacterium]